MLSLAILAQISEVAAPALLAKAGATIDAGIAVIGAGLGIQDFVKFSSQFRS